MDMGTIMVKGPDGEEREIDVAELLKERRSAPPAPSFQVKTIWAIGSSTLGFILVWMFTTGAGEKLRKIDEHEMKIQQLQVSVAERGAVTEVKYNHIISAQAEFSKKQEVMAAMLSDIKGQLDRRRSEPAR